MVETCQQNSPMARFSNDPGIKYSLSVVGTLCAVVPDISEYVPVITAGRQHKDRLSLAREALHSSVSP